MTTRLLSFSEISSALTCTMRHDLAYVGHAAGSALKSRAVGRRLTEGRAFGAAVATWPSWLGRSDGHPSRSGGGR